MRERAEKRDSNYKIYVVELEVFRNNSGKVVGK